MIESDKPAFASAMNDFGVIYNHDITPPLLRVYWEVLKDMKLGDFERAVGVIHRTGEFFPKPSDFIRAERAGWT